jgi:hypothetical protein
MKTAPLFRFGALSTSLSISSPYCCFNPEKIVSCRQRGFRYSWHFPLTVSIRSPLNISITFTFSSNFSFIVRNMNSEADSSLLAPLITLDSALTKSKRDTSAHATWTHTRTTLDEMPKSKNEARLLYCAYCSKEPLYSNTVTYFYPWFGHTVRLVI